MKNRQLRLYCDLRSYEMRCWSVQSPQARHNWVNNWLIQTIEESRSVEFYANWKRWEFVFLRPTTNISASDLTCILLPPDDCSWVGRESEPGIDILWLNRKLTKIQIAKFSNLITLFCSKLKSFIHFFIKYIFSWPQLVETVSHPILNNFEGHFVGHITIATFWKFTRNFDFKGNFLNVLILLVSQVTCSQVVTVDIDIELPSVMLSELHSFTHVYFLIDVKFPLA